MKMQTFILLTIALLKTDLAHGGETNKESGGVGAVGGATNQPPKLSGFMTQTRVVTHPDQPTIEKLQVVKPKLKRARAARADKSGPQNLEEAAQYLATSVNMACPPGACLEREGFFYFSGGRSTQFETNFLSGYAIKKNDTAIYFWERDHE